MESAEAAVAITMVLDDLPRKSRQKAEHGRIAASMGATRTLSVDLRRLEGAGEDGVLVLRLMSAANDLAAANRALRDCAAGLGHLRMHMRDGLRRYFIRLQCGHLTEALPLIEEVEKSETLALLTGRVSVQARAGYARLQQCLKGGASRRNFERYVLSVRNSVAFHYSRKVVSKALKARARCEQTRYSHITQGDSIDTWRFNVADDIEVSAVWRGLWGVPDGADQRAEDDRISGFVSELCLDFILVAGELCSSFVQKNAAS